MDIVGVMRFIESILLSGMKIAFYMIIILMLFIVLEYLVSIIVKTIKSEK